MNNCTLYSVQQNVECTVHINNELFKLYIDHIVCTLYSFYVHSTHFMYTVLVICTQYSFLCTLGTHLYTQYTFYEHINKYIHCQRFYIQNTKMCKISQDYNFVSFENMMKQVWANIDVFPNS